MQVKWGLIIGFLTSKLFARYLILTCMEYCKKEFLEGIFHWWFFDWRITTKELYFFTWASFNGYKFQLFLWFQLFLALRAFKRLYRLVTWLYFWYLVLLLILYIRRQNWPNLSLQEPFPMGNNIRVRPGKSRNNGNEENRSQGNPSPLTSGEESGNGSGIESSSNSSKNSDWFSLMH